MAELENCSKPPEPVVMNLTHEEAKAAGLDLIETDQTKMVSDKDGTKRRKPGKHKSPPSIRVLAGQKVTVPDEVLEAAQVKVALALRKIRVAKDAQQVKKPKPSRRQRSSSVSDE